MRDSYLSRLRSYQNGAVLLLAMIFLLLLAIVAGTVMQTSVLEFQMAGNDQFREEAFQRAQAIASEISADLDNFPITGTVGYTVCTATDPDPDCTVDTLNDPNSAVSPAGVNLSYQIRRQGPLFIESLPFRQAQNEAAGAPNFDAAIFEVNVDVNGSEVRLGSSRIVQGVAVRIPQNKQ